MQGKKVDLSSGTKPCPKCNTTKPLSEFGVNKYTASGFSSYCKPCMADQARVRRATPEGKAAHRASTERWIASLESKPATPGFKVCPKCQISKPFEQYPKNKRTKHGINAYCLVCAAEIVRAHRATPEGAQAHRDASKRWRDANTKRHKDNNARWKYGVAHGGYDTLLAKQDGKCAICDSSDPGSRLERFHIDHDHASGKVRGLLCELCNRGLGSFKDRVALLSRAISYLNTSAEGG